MAEFGEVGLENEYFEFPEDDEEGLIRYYFYRGFEYKDKLYYFFRRIMAFT